MSPLLQGAAPATVAGSLDRCPAGGLDPHLSLDHSPAGIRSRFGRHAVRKSFTSGAGLPGLDLGSACLLLRRPRDIESLKPPVPQFPVPHSGVVFCWGCGVPWGPLRVVTLRLCTGCWLRWAPRSRFFIFCVVHCLPEASVASLSSVVGIPNVMQLVGGESLHPLSLQSGWKEECWKLEGIRRLHGRWWWLVAQSYLILCSPTDYSMPGLLVLHSLPELAQFMSVESVMLSNYLILCCLLLLLPSVFPSISLFQWVGSSHQVAKVLELQASDLPMSIQGWFPLGWTGFTSLQSRDFKESSPTPQFKSICFSALSAFMVQLSHPYMATGKTTALTNNAGGVVAEHPPPASLISGWDGLYLDSPREKWELLWGCCSCGHGVETARGAAPPCLGCRLVLGHRNCSSPGIQVHPGGVGRGYCPAFLPQSRLVRALLSCQVVSVSFYMFIFFAGRFSE